jgi:hypothetical protein
MEGYVMESKESLMTAANIAKELGVSPGKG